MTASRRILVVDDSDDNREAVSALLRFMKYNVREANCGDDALSIAESFKPELLLIDVKMPGMSGLQLLEKINCTGHACEAVMMTGHESVDDACKAMELGAISYLRKPICYEDLVKHIDEGFRKVDGYISGERQKISLEEAAARHARKAEESFKVAEFQSRRFDLILDNMQEPLIAIDGYRRVMMVNSAAERAFGIKVGEALDQPVEAVFTESSISHLIDSFDSHIDQDNDAAFKSFLEFAGRHYAVSVSRLVGHDGSEVGSVLIFTDTTSQHRVEQLRTMFLSVVSHEFKTPLSILMNAAAMLGMKRHCSGEVEAVKDTIDETCIRLTRLVNAVVTFARINHDDVHLAIASIDIYYLLAQSIVKFGEIAQAKKVTIVQTPPGGFRNAGTDGELVAVAIDCILDNAVKYSPEHGTIEIGYRLAVEENVNLLNIFIGDEGPGIPPEKIDSVFEWFGQGEDPLRRKSGGLGLGLPLARRAVEMLRGTITIGSGPHGGCRVEIAVPVAEVAS